jgi:LysM repeat protein
MKKRSLYFLFSFLLMGLLSQAQSSEVIRQYISRYKEVAMEEMIRTGVPAAITLAQGIHETGAGTSDLVLASNNHFGIKCKTEWTGAAVYHDDDAKGECFRKYDDPRDSYRDHSDFLKNRPYYTALFKLDPEDYQGWAYGLKKAGYATNPRYPQILIKLIEDYNLQDYTLMALNKKPAAGNDVVWTSNTMQSESVANARVEPARRILPSYPEGRFQVNQTSVVRIEKGTSFLKVAEENRLSLPRLFEFNDMTPVDIATEDQLVFLQRKRKTGPTAFHILAEGETVYDVAQSEGIRLESLLEYNNLKKGMQPAAGEKLYLQSQAPSTPRLATEKDPAHAVTPVSADSANSPVVHTVQPKETLFAIARKYGISVDEVVASNDLRSMDLRTGQQLKINKRTVNAN